jgi:hypothetical protein
MSANLAYLKAETDKLYISFYNNDGATLNGGDPISFDPSYTSGLGCVGSIVASDQRCIGTVKAGTTVSSHATGLALCPGFIIQSVNVTGAVVFGHSLVASTSLHYAQDSGGGAITYGSIGWALAANVSGTAAINALCIRSNPLYYVAAQVITQKYSGQGAYSSGTIIANVVNVTPNQCLLFFDVVSTNGSMPTNSWNSLTPTALQTGAVAGAAYVGALLGAGAATADYVVGTSGTSGYKSAVVLAMNGINQGGGAASFGTIANQNGNGASVNVTVTCAPGDKVICAVTAVGTSLTFSGGNQTSELSVVAANSGVDVQSAVATGTSVNFTLTIGGSITHWSADGLALKSA